MSNGDTSEEDEHEQGATDFSPAEEAEEAEEEDTDEEEATDFSPAKDEKEDG